MPEPSDHERVNDYLLQLYGDDPFAPVRKASEVHRTEHAASLPGVGEQECGVYPSDPLKIRFLATLVRALAPRRMLEIGCGLGYSALWLAGAAPVEARIETIDRFPDHVALAEGYAKSFGLADRISVIEGAGADILPRLEGPYDLIHDDGWFAQEPPYFGRMVQLLRPGGLLVMSNWFLLSESLLDKPLLDWSRFAGPSWREHVQAYAKALTARPDLHVSFVLDPAVALALKLP
ncbi:MAG: class I SAM-dependent methyltransferase [Dehalococcoidia bacterium]|nr:class I SAM-dependent methyltransferase [Dehalococcoidia bacterium]